MSLYNLARQVQSKGRGDDTMLVHMTPGEVKGLQALAMKHGGSLSINPDTGLPEAGFLKNILPSVVGGAVGIATGMPFLGAAVGGGLGMATSGGNLSKGIMSGIGAYGFGSLGANLATSGAGALGAAAAPAAELAGTAALESSMGSLGQVYSPQMLSEKVAQGLISPEAASAYGQAYSSAFGQPSTMASIQEGFKTAAASPGAFFKQNMFPIGAAALGTLAATSQDQQYGIPPAQTGTIRPYTYSQTRNPEFGKVPGAPYFTQTYTAGTPYAAKEGGIITLASGGMPSGPVERMSMNDMKPGMYPQGMMDKTEYATPTQRPASMEIIKSDYDVGVNPMTGLQDLGMAGGGIVALANGGAPNVPPVDPIALAPNLGQYTRPAPAVNPAVTAYNQILADRAAQEYVVQPPPLNMLPGGGEQANVGDTQKLINQYYLSELGRQGDPEGLKYWAQRKMDTGESLADIKKQIAGSPEGQIYGLYRDVLGRRPDEEGASYWRGLLESGTPIADIRKQFEASQEFKAKPARTATTAKPSLGGYTYDPLTGQYTKAPEPEQKQPDFSGFMDFANDPNFRDFLYRQYQQAQQSVGGAKAGGLMGYAKGGISDLGDYSDGGRLLKGPGDGVSDSIPAQIGERQPARLADGEFVVPARIVSELGNGSTDAGARKLYAMMDRIQKRRKKSVGKGKVAVDSKAESLLPA